MDNTILNNIPYWLAPLFLALSLVLFFLYIPLVMGTRFERCRNCKGKNPIEVQVCAHCGNSTQVLRPAPYLWIIFLIILFSLLTTLIALVKSIAYDDPPWDKLAVSGAGFLVLILAAVLATWARARSMRLKKLFVLQKKDFYGGFCGGCGTEILGGNKVCTNCGKEVTFDPPNWTTNPAAGDPLIADPHIICYKCKTANPSTSTRCQKCGMDLLTYKPVWLRFLYFLISIIFMIGCGWLAYRIYQSPEFLNVLDTFMGDVLIFLIAATVVSPFVGIGLAFGKGNPYELLVERADRHLKEQPWQALTDYSLALEIAPVNKHRKILSNRMNLFTSLGLMQNSIRDELAGTYARENNPEGGIGLFLGDNIIGSMGPSGAFEKGYLAQVSKQARKDRERMFRDGKVIALGWCPACNCIMELDKSLHCPNPDNLKRHPGKPKFIQFVVPADNQAGRDAIPRLMEAGKKKSRRRVLTFVAAVILLSAACWLIDFFINK